MFGTVRPNTAVERDALHAALRAFFGAPYRERKDFPAAATVAVVTMEERTASL